MDLPEGQREQSRLVFKLGFVG